MNGEKWNVSGHEFPTMPAQQQEQNCKHIIAVEILTDILDKVIDRIKHKSGIISQTYLKIN